MNTTKDKMYQPRRLGDKVVKITSIEYHELRVGNPNMVDVEVKENGKTYTRTYDVVLNHDFEDGRFRRKMLPGEEPFDYQGCCAFETPIIHILPNGEISEFVREEFERRFKEQRQKEKW